MIEKNKMKSGFINIIGSPNAGKSTLLNALMQDKWAITSPKPQTTRQRLLVVRNEGDNQFIFSDSPGYIASASYKLHHAMNNEIEGMKNDADVFMLVIDPTDKHGIHPYLVNMLKKSEVPAIIIINKIDIANSEQIQNLKQELQKLELGDNVYEMSALSQEAIEPLLQKLSDFLPEHPFYFDSETSSDKSVRFFIAELIREKIFQLFSDEIPYSVIVSVDSCKGVDDNSEMAKIEARIFVNKSSQLAIIVGKNGAKIKELGIQSRLEIEKFLRQKVHLGLTAKLKENWREDQSFITKIGMKP